MRITAGSAKVMFTAANGNASVDVGSTSLSHSFNNVDILISGSTIYDGNLAAGKSWQPNLTALLALMAEWQSGDSYETRVQDLFGDRSGGRNGAFRLDSSTLLPSAAVSRLFASGQVGQNWFWVKSADKVSGWASGDVVSME